jgi:hypothetical protein
MHDLNALIPPDSPLYLLIAYGSNDSEEIAGFGVNATTGDVHAFLATPSDCSHSETDWCKQQDRDGSATGEDRTVERPKVFLSEGTRRLLRQLALRPTLNWLADS